jgi:hypothetical protein
MPRTDESRWESTSIQNLIRYRPPGSYFARFKVGGKLVRQSLETAVFSVAKQRLPDKIREYRSRHESVKAFAGGSGHRVPKCMKTPHRISSETARVATAL